MFKVTTLLQYCWQTHSPRLSARHLKKQQVDPPSQDHHHYHHSINVKRLFFQSDHSIGRLQNKKNKCRRSDIVHTHLRAAYLIPLSLIQSQVSSPDMEAPMSLWIIFLLSGSLVSL